MENSTTTNKTYLVPAIFSFFLPGAGQLLKRQWWRAFTFYGLAIAGVILCGMLSMPAILWQGLVLVLWVWQVYDTYTSQRDWK